MQPWIAVSVASILFAAGLAGVAFAIDQEDAPVVDDAHVGHEPELLEHGMAGDHATPSAAGGHAHDVGMERPAFPPSEGSVPTAEDARSMEQVRSLRIIGDEEADPESGVRSGSGTLDDPYLITGYYVTGDLYIQDTDACYEVKENYIGGQLSLNWNGQCVFVHHNFIRDLRVNENIHRTGYATGGLIEQNKIEFVGQLRHYDGEFRFNEVGPRQADSAWDMILETTPFLAPRYQVANIDGFNQGLIHHNTFEGSVDLDFHGHHHGTGFFAPHSHYHGEDMERAMDHDHTDRWTSVSFTDNVVIDPEGYGLRYEDRNHAGDDRLANSEQEETLEHDHVHHLDVLIARNTIQDAPLWVDVFMADDRNHAERNEGWLEISGNTVHMKQRASELPFGFFGPGFRDTSAITVYAAKEVELEIKDNVLSWTPAEDDGTLPVVGGMFQRDLPPTGIDLHKVDLADVTITGNTGEGFEYGVRAQHFTEDVSWGVGDNAFPGALHEVWYDDSVANEPDQR